MPERIAVAALQNMPAARNMSNGKPSRFSRPGIATIKRTSLTLEERLSIDGWLDVGLHIDRMADSSSWWLGDWLVYGRECYPNRYKDAMENTPLDYQTLRNYAWVAGRIEISRRRDTLSFQHHAEVASLPTSVQDKWLDKAQENGWSRNRLRAEIRSSLKGSGEITRSIQFRLNGERLTRWKRAAAREGQDLLIWMARNLDEAAASIGSAATE